MNKNMVRIVALCLAVLMLFGLVATILTALT